MQNRAARQSPKSYQVLQVLTQFYAAYPQWKTTWQNPTLPKQGHFSTVLFVGHEYVVKSANNRPNAKAYLGTEAWVLRHFSREANRQKMTLRELLGVDVPPYIEPKESYLTSLFAMGRVDGHMRSLCLEYSDHPDVIDQLATFMMQMDRILSSAVTKYHQGNPQDPLDRIMSENWKAFDAGTKDKPALISWFDPSLFERGKAHIQSVAPSFKPYLEQAERTMARKLKQAPTQRRFMHGDFHAGNTLFSVWKGPEGDDAVKVNVSVVDFGILFCGDPHIGFALMFATAGEPSIRMLLKIANEVNKRSLEETHKPWMNTADCLALIPVVLAVNAGKTLIDRTLPLSKDEEKSFNSHLLIRLEDTKRLIDQARPSKQNSYEMTYPARNDTNVQPASGLRLVCG